MLYLDLISDYLNLCTCSKDPNENFSELFSSCGIHFINNTVLRSCMWLVSNYNCLIIADTPGPAHLRVWGVEWPKPKIGTFVCIAGLLKIVDWLVFGLIVNITHKVSTWTTETKEIHLPLEHNSPSDLMFTTASISWLTTHPIERPSSRTYHLRHPSHLTSHYKPPAVPNESLEGACPASRLPLSPSS